MRPILSCSFFQVIKPDLSRASLHFNALTVWNFATYTIVARNDHGSSEAEIELLRERTSTFVGEKKPQRKNPRNDPKYQVARSKSDAGKVAYIFYVYEAHNYVGHYNMSSNVGYMGVRRVKGALPTGFVVCFSITMNGY